MSIRDYGGNAPDPSLSKSKGGQGQIVHSEPYFTKFRCQKFNSSGQGFTHTTPVQSQAENITHLLYYSPPLLEQQQYPEASQPRGPQPAHSHSTQRVDWWWLQCKGCGSGGSGSPHLPQSCSSTQSWGHRRKGLEGDVGLGTRSGSWV